MTRAFVTQTSFTAGELDPRMLGRIELRSYENGAARLRNVVVETTGGVRRRPGTAFIAQAEGRGRLVGVEFGRGEAYLLAFSDFRVDVYRDGIWRAFLITPWSESQIPELTWAQHRASLIVAHPGAPLQRIERQSETVWSIAELDFEDLEVGKTAAPFARFADPDVAIQASATTGTVTLTTSAPFFIAEHLGVCLLIKGKPVEITNVQTNTQAIGLVIEDLLDTDPTADWEELAFSAARGWPATVTFHQDRMVLGGSRDLPNTLWLSRTGRPRNFDLGDGLADEAIEFRLAADDVQAIRALVPGRQLQVFTGSGEWVVRGEPLTPENIQVDQQSRIGSPVDRFVPPRDVDGATLFVARNGREVREFVFNDTEFAYQAADLALLSRHLVQDPVDQAFDRPRRLLLVVMADGNLATIAIYRNADIAAWSLQETRGDVLSVAVAGGESWLLVDRPSGLFIERLTDGLMVDAGLRLTTATPTTTFAGLNHLEGELVAVVADGFVLEPRTVVGGAIEIERPAREVVVGLPYTHLVEPLPPVAGPLRAAALAATYRPIRVSLRLFETQNVRIDTGDGLRELPLHRVGAGPADRSPAPVTDDFALRALGWRRGTAQPPWRIEQDAPLPWMLLSASTEIKVND